MKQDAVITIRVSKDWLERLDAWIEGQTIRPSRTEVIRAAIDQLIEGKKPPLKRKKP